MEMGIVETRHREMPAQVYDLCLRSFQSFDVESFADSLNAVPTHRNRLLAKNGIELGVGGYTGINIRVNENQVGFRLGLGCRLPHGILRRAWQTTQSRKGERNNRPRPIPARTALRRCDHSKMIRGFSSGA